MTNEQAGTNGRNGAESTNESDLGRRLRELSDKALASGIDTLSTEQIHELIAEVRGRPS
jgi:hypothetical protein